MEGPTFDGMSTFELIQVYYLAKETAIEGVVISMTILFAFITAAYVAGVKLKRSQAYGITILYSFVLLFSLFNLFQDLVIMNATLAAMYGAGNVGNEMYLPVVLVFLCWLYSLFFLADVRREHIT